MRAVVDVGYKFILVLSMSHFTEKIDPFSDLLNIFNLSKTKDLPYIIIDKVFPEKVDLMRLQTVFQTTIIS